MFKKKNSQDLHLNFYYNKINFLSLENDPYLFIKIDMKINNL